MSTSGRAILLAITILFAADPAAAQLRSSGSSGHVHTFRRSSSGSSRSGSSGSTHGWTHHSGGRSRHSRSRWRSYSHRHRHHHYYDDHGWRGGSHHGRGRAGGGCSVCDGSADSDIGMGLSIGPSVTLFDASMNGLRGARLVRGDLVAGELATFETDIRWWLVVQRLRLGIVAQFGLAPDSGLVPSREGDDLEVGSTFGWGSRWSLAAFGAYALQPVDHVQVWFGARAGGSFLAIPLYSSGRHYADLRRDSWSAGPELGLRFYAGCAGVMFWGFADLVQLGVFQAGVSFSFEFPVVSGTAF